jgi:hypothetical protein
VLLELLTQASAHGIHPRGIQVLNARIRGGMTWDWQELAVPLSLTDSVIDGPFILDHARVAGLSLARCALPGLSALHLTSASGLEITDSTISGMVVLRSATLAGTLLLSGSTIHGEPSELDGSP